MKQGTSASIDDILVNEDIVAASHVAKHLERHGLTAKACERVVDGARMLGLRVCWGEGWKATLDV